MENERILNPVILDFPPKCGMSLCGLQYSMKTWKPLLPFFSKEEFSSQSSLSGQPFCKCSGKSYSYHSSGYLWDKAHHSWSYILLGPEHLKTYSGNFLLSICTSKFKNIGGLSLPPFLCCHPSPGGIHLSCSMGNTCNSMSLGTHWISGISGTFLFLWSSQKSDPS